MAYRVLIVEDDRAISGTLCAQLNQWGFEAVCAEDFHDVLGTFVRYSPQLVLMDITLPFFNGYYWCGEIRKISKVPLMFLSSAGDSMNIVMAMNQGADDFVSKPFDVHVLVAKMKALLRRAYDFQGTAHLMEHHGAILNLSDASLLVNGERIDLTKNEFRILQVLLENKGRTVARDTLMMRLWESDSFIDDNTLTVNVTRLRRKLEQAGLPDFIRTKKGLGYLAEA